MGPTEVLRAVAVVLLAGASTTMAIPVGPGTAAAATGGPGGPVACDFWVSDAGANISPLEDQGRGTTKAKPFRTIDVAFFWKAPPALTTICVPAGATLTLPKATDDPTAPNFKWTRSNAVLAGDPEATTRPKVIGQLSINVDNVTVRDLDISNGVWSNGRAPATVRVWGDKVSLQGNTISAAWGSCVEVGYLDMTAAAVDVAATVDERAAHQVTDTKVTGNDIGPCAADPTKLGSWTCNASGLPGIYSQWAVDLDIQDNVIWNTALRGIQLYPKNDDVLIEDNLLRRNSIAMNIGTDAYGATAAVKASRQATRIVVRNNVFAEQTAQELATRYTNLGAGCSGNRYLTDNSPPAEIIDDQATEHWKTTGPDLVASATVMPTATITGNCGWRTYWADENPWSARWGNMTFAPNDARTPTFASATDHDQTASSPCANQGPVRHRPTATAVEGLEILPQATPQTGSIGDVVSQGYAIANRTGATRTVTVSPTQLPPTGAGQPAAYTRLSGTGCGSTSCTLDIPDGATATVTLKIAAARAGSLSSAMRATAPGVVAATGSRSTTIAGAVGTTYCTAPYGTSGNDTLKATNTSQSSVILCGFEGNDVLKPQLGTFGDQLLGGTGTDVVDYAAAPGGWQIDLALQRAQRYPTTGDQTVLASIEGATGTGFADKLTGSTGANTLRGGGGNDAITGGDGNDALYGDAGNDTVDGGNGNDALYGGDGDDGLLGRSGDDVVNGGTGRDTASYANNGTAVIVSLAVATGVAQNTGGAGTDKLSYIENLYGGNANDALRGSTGVNTISGGPGNDNLYGGDADDTLSGNDGNDNLYGEAGTSDRCLQGSGAGVVSSTCERTT